MDGIVDLGAGLRFGVAGVDRETRRVIAARVDPYALEPASRTSWPALGGVAFVVAGPSSSASRARQGAAAASQPARVRPVPRAEIAGDVGDGIVAAWDGVRLRLMVHGAACVFPDGLGEPPTFELSRGFLAWSLGLGPIELAAQIAALDAGGVVVHGSAVELDGRAIVIGGWSESGKTEAALGLIARGGHFISDKWTYLAADGTVRPFPARVGVRGWVSDALPGVRALLPARSRWQQRSAALLAGLMAQPWARPRGRASAAALVALGRARSIADRASMAPSDIIGHDSTRRARILRGTPLGAVVMLAREDADEMGADGPRRVNPGSRGIAIERFADPAEVARRFARSAAAERPLLRQLHDRWAFAAAGLDTADHGRSERRPESRVHPLAAEVPARPLVAMWPIDPEVVRLAEENRIGVFLERAAVLGVRAPFPAHPLVLADAIGAAVRDRLEEPPQTSGGGDPASDAAPDESRDVEVGRVPMATAPGG